MTIYTYDLDPAFDALAVFECLHHRPFSLLLDSADLAHRDAAYSFVAAFPLEVIEGKDGIYSVTNAKGTQNLKNTNPFDLVRERMRHYKMSLFSFEGGAPFQGGAAGLFGYDLARALESLPNHAKSDPQMPDMALGIYDQVFAYDHKAGKGTLYIHAREAEQADAKHAHYCKMLEQAARRPPLPKTSNRNGRAILAAPTTKRPFKRPLITSTRGIFFRPIFPSVSMHSYPRTSTLTRITCIYGR